ACLGLVAGLLAALAASLLAWVLAEQVFNISVNINYQIWLIGPFLSMLIVVAGGLAGTRQVFTLPPVTVLRQV
ncbi:MAG: hypothetical protein MI673_10400, partial [Thiotrichales bacterium]|nr:hypothetical protein [Thiotrichales bacterium]